MANRPTRRPARAATAATTPPAQESPEEAAARAVPLPDTHAPQVPSASELAAEEARQRRPEVDVPGLSRVVGDMQSERIGQVLRKGKTYEADDDTGWKQLTSAGVAYAKGAVATDGKVPPEWPFEPDSFDHLSPRDMLVRAGALLIAAAEAMDRSAKLAEARALVAAADARKSGE